MAEEEKPDVRASDADREAVAERLRTAHAEGRLDWPSTTTESEPPTRR